MKFAISTVAVAPVRTEPAHRSEMSNQLLFGETMEVMEEKDEWLRVRSSYDGYEGWLTYHLVKEIEKSWWEQPIEFVASDAINPINYFDQAINAPMGSSLVGFDRQTGLLWDGKHSYQGSYRDISGQPDLSIFDKISQAWVNAPYLWGGKTIMGVDCSGFAQTVFKVLGVRLLRDAYQQAEQGESVPDIESSQKGDLAFFHNEKGRVTHVGIILGDGRIIHASGKVRIDKLDEQGIISTEFGKRTHDLHSMKRYF